MGQVLTSGEVHPSRAPKKGPRDPQKRIQQWIQYLYSIFDLGDRLSNCRFEVVDPSLDSSDFGVDPDLGSPIVGSGLFGRPPGMMLRGIANASRLNYQISFRNITHFFVFSF